MFRRAGVAGLFALSLLLGCPNQGASGGGAAAGGGGVKMVTQKSGTPVANVGESVITVEELEEKINAQGPFARPRFQDVAKRREFLEGLIRQEVLAQEAVRRGYDKDPEVQDALKKVMVQKLTRLEYDSQVKQEDIKPEDVKKYYDEHPDEFHKPEMARCSAVIVANKDGGKKKAETALKAVKDAAAKKPEPGKPISPDPFRDVVMAHSEDAESKALGGDLKYLTRKEMEEKHGTPVAEACFTLANVNDLSGVVEGKQGFYVLKSTGKRKPIDRTLEQVETQIRNRLFRERRTESFNKFVEDLKNKATVKVDDAKLAAMKIAGGPAPSAQMPPPHSNAPALGEPTEGEEGKDPHGH
ncbi:MAG: peptidyl-prolyl cis-trans isomerase [Myxococcota bacterium]